VERSKAVYPHPAPKAPAAPGRQVPASAQGAGSPAAPASAPKAAVKPKPAAKMAPKAGDIVYHRAEPEEKKEAADQQPPYTVVKVYYATDRSPLDLFQWRQSLRGGWPLLTGLLAVLTAALMLWRPRRRRFVVRGLAWGSLVATVILGGLTVAYQWQPEPKADGQIERMYGGDRGELELGVCEVSVPKEHQVGALESPTVLRLEFREDPERHVVLLGVHPESPSKFYADLRACIDRTARKEAFVFIHGYNVGFATAVRRTAQIAYDLKFEGAPIVYSWPSQEGLLSYTVDETNVAWTVPHLKDFLLGVAQQSGAKSVHLVAHSMGNRALSSALHELALERKAECPRFHEVVLTAPDIDADVFRRDLAPAIIRTADRVTLYASSNDEALVASRTVHGYRRAGESGDKMMVVPGVDTVDVSEVDTSFIGHSYYGSNSTVLADLFELLRESKPADQRKWLRSMRLGAQKYWKFLRGQASSSPPPAEQL
jgi:esterase/lipase superfamily enzyme